MDNTEIAVIGMSCRFNTAGSVYSLHRALLGGKGCKCGDNGERAALTGYCGEAGLDRRIAYIKDIERFDNEYFGISDREAVYLSPEIRISLELAAEALFDAGYTADMLKGKCCGVIASISGEGYNELCIKKDMLSINGSSRSMAAGIIAKHIGADGPVLMTDSDACSSSVGIITAADMLRSGTADMMLVGGTELAIFSNDDGSEAFMSSISPENSCIPYSKKAMGTVTGEGGGFVVLKRLDDAVRDGDVICGRIIGYAAGNALTDSQIFAPDKETMLTVMRKAWEKCSNSPDEFEGGAIGIPSSDNTEAEAFEEFSDNNVICGSVRHSVGHTGHLCGLASLIKVMLSFRNHVTYPLGAYAAKGMLKTEKLIFPFAPVFHSAEKQRYIGINSFGANGACVHIAAANYIVAERTVSQSADEQLVVISADTEEQLTRLTDMLEEHLVRCEWDINDVIYTLNTKRRLGRVRYAFFCRDRRELLDKLSSCRKVIMAGMNEVILLTRKDNENSDKVAEKFLESGLFVRYVGEYSDGALKLKRISDGSFVEYRDVNSPLIVSTFDDPLADILLSEESFTDCIEMCACNSAYIEWDKYYKDKEAKNYPMPSVAFANKKFWYEVDSVHEKIVSQATVDKAVTKQIERKPTTEDEIALMDGLCGIIQKHLELTDKIGYDDNFFELGGNSLTGGMALAEFRDKYGIDISFTDMYENPTVRSIIVFYMKRK